MIDVSDIVIDVDLCEPLSILRSVFAFGLVDSNTETSILTYGIVTPSKGEELQQIPEGDRPIGGMTFRSTTPFRLSAESPSENADVVLWRGVRWKIIYVFPWDHFGMNKAIGVLENANQGVLLP